MYFSCIQIDMDSNVQNNNYKSYLSSYQTVDEHLEVNSRSQGLTRLNILNKTTVGAWQFELLSKLKFS